MKRSFKSSVELADRRRKRNSIIIGLLLIFLMLFSLISYSFYDSSTDTDIVHNGYTLRTQTIEGVNVLTTKYNGEDIFFYSAPLIAYTFKNEEFEKVYNSSSTLIFTRDPPELNNSYYQDEVYYSALFNHVSGFTEKRVIIASTKENIYDDLPILTCEDATENRLVIYLNNINTSEYNSSKKLITMSDYCFGASATGSSILSLRDYILYAHLGIKND